MKSASSLPLQVGPALPISSGSRKATAQAIGKTVGSRLGWIVVSAGTGMITARVLGPAGRGALAAMIMWPVFLAGTLTFGLPSALIYCMRQSERKNHARLFSTAVTLAAIIGVIASVLAIFVLPSWLSGYGVQVVHRTQWLMLFTLSSVLMLIFRAAFEATAKFGTSAATWLLCPLQTLAALLVLSTLDRLTELTAALSYVLAGVPVVVWMFLRLRRELGWDLSGFVGSSRELLSYGLRSYGVDLCGTLAQSVDQALVVGMISASEMGRYVVALSLSRILSAVYQATAAVLFPKCIGLSARQSFVITMRVLMAATAVALPGALLICAWGASILRLLYGQDYVLAATLLQLLTAEAVLAGVSTVMAQPLMAIGRPGTVTMLQATSLAATIPLLLLLVPRFGITGAGAALLSSAVLRLLLVVGLYSRIPSRLPRRSELRSLRDELMAGVLRPFSTSVQPAEPAQ